MSKLSHYLHPPRQRPWWICAGVLVLAVASICCVYYAYLTSLSTCATLARLDTEQTRRAATLPLAPTRLQLEQQKMWRQLALERDFNWDNLFQALQNANHPDIELLEFRPEKQQGAIILRGEAKSVAALSEYLQKISLQPAFAQIYLARQDLRAHGQLETAGFEIRGTLRK